MRNAERRTQTQRRVETCSSDGDTTCSPKKLRKKYRNGRMGHTRGHYPRGLRKRAKHQWIKRYGDATGVEHRQAGPGRFKNVGAWWDDYIEDAACTGLSRNAYTCAAGHTATNWWQNHHDEIRGVSLRCGATVISATAPEADQALTCHPFGVPAPKG